MYHIDLMRKKFSLAITSGCRETGKQKISLAEMGECLSLKGEQISCHDPKKPEKRCDCIVICEDDTTIRFAALELKSNEIKGRQIIEKLKNCNRIIQNRILPIFIGHGKTEEFVFAVYSSGGRNASESKIITGEPIRGKTIITVKYGQPLRLLFKRK